MLYQHLHLASPQVSGRRVLLFTRVSDSFGIRISDFPAEEPAIGDAAVIRADRTAHHCHIPGCSCVRGNGRREFRLGIFPGNVSDRVLALFFGKGYNKGHRIPSFFSFLPLPSSGCLSRCRRASPEINGDDFFSFCHRSHRDPLHERGIQAPPSRVNIYRGHPMQRVEISDSTIHRRLFVRLFLAFLLVEETIFSLPYPARRYCAQRTEDIRPSPHLLRIRAGGSVAGEYSA